MANYARMYLNHNVSEKNNQASFLQIFNIDSKKEILKNSLYFN